MSSSAPPRRTKYVTGIHIVRKKLASGDTYYVYAWRGGPQIHKSSGRYPQVTPSILAKQQKAIADYYKTSDTVPRIDNLIRLYEESPSFKNLAENTRKDYQRYFNRISEHFGKMPLEAFNDTRMRGQIITWRNQWLDKPRAADMAAMMMNILLGFGVEMGMLTNNVATRIKVIHKVNRSELIWEDSHWQAFYDAKPPQHIIDVVELGSMTGLRLSDLLALTWDQVSIKAIIIEKTMKTKSRVTIPITRDLCQWLDNRTDRTGTILKNSRGFPWTKDGFESSYVRKRPAGFDRHFHDLRGTYATKLILKGLTDEEIAKILGWKSTRVSEIRSRYVNDHIVIMNIAERLDA